MRCALRCGIKWKLRSRRRNQMTYFKTPMMMTSKMKNNSDNKDAYINLNYLDNELIVVKDYFQQLNT